MSLRANGLPQIPAETSRVARAVFPNRCLAMRARDGLGPLFTDEQFAELFAARGRPAWSPARLALVLVLVLVEGLTDRQAADAGEHGWTGSCALGLDLSDPGFDASVLTELARAAARRWPDRAAARAVARVGWGSAACWARAGASAPTRPISTWRSVIFTGRKQVIETLRAAQGGPGGGGARLAGRADPARVGATLRPARR
jgi:hypothetical protein